MPKQISDALVLVDASNLFYRSHWAHVDLATDEGIPSGMIYGFLYKLLLLKKEHGYRILFLWDCSRHNSWRRLEYPPYKAKRDDKPKDPDFVTAIDIQLPQIRKALSALGYRNVYHDKLEADDLIALCAFANRRGQTVIFSRDQDMFQLLHKGVTQIVPTGRETGDQTFNSNTVLRKYGVAVSDWAQYLALGGDSADNVTLPGMGPKTAIKLLNAGVNLKRTLDKQYGLDPKSTAYITPRWKGLKRAYRLTSLPLRTTDSRISSFVEPDFLSWVPTYQPDTPTPSNRKTFERILDNFQLAQLKGLAKEYYRHGRKRN